MNLIRRGFCVFIPAKSDCFDELKEGKITVLPAENLGMTREISIVCHSAFGYYGYFAGHHPPV